MSSRRLPVPSLLATALLATLALAGLASADVLTLHGGATLEGRLVEQRANEVVFEHKLGGQATRSTFERSIVDKLEITAGLGTREAAGPVTSARYPEAKTYARRVGILVDRSGSMAIGDRWPQALDEVDTILAQLADQVDVCVWAFDRKAQNLFEGNHPKVGLVRGQVRQKLEALGVNLEGYTDLAAALGPAVAFKCEALYLVTDGIPTQGEPSAAWVVRGLKEHLKLLPPPKNVPLNVVLISGGTYELGSVENADGARAIGKALAAETQGSFREVVASDHSKAPLALKPLKDLNPPPDDVTFNLYRTDGSGSRPTFDGSRRFFLREFVDMTFLVEIEDPALQRGPVILEYATQPNAPRIELETYPLATVSPKLYDWKRDMSRLQAWIGDRDIDFNSLTPGTNSPGTLRLYQRIILVRTLDDRKCGMHNLDRSDENNAFIKLPVEGGTLDIIYRRGARTFRHTLFINSPFHPK